MKVTPKKRFGQNFLQDQFVINRIVDSIKLQKSDNVVEIGPGMAALTRPVLEVIDRLNVVEIDNEAITYLQHYLDPSQVIINQADALKFDFSTLGEQLRVIGNLPYNISTPLLFKLLDFTNIIDMHFMLQKEVVERICAKPGNKDYGKLSVIMQYLCKCEMLFVVPPESFYPAPKVDSAIIRITPYTNIANKVDIEKFNQLLSQSFSMRRKTINNNLKGILEAADWDKLGLDKGLRPEALTLNDYLQIYNYIY